MLMFDCQYLHDASIGLTMNISLKNCICSSINPLALEPTNKNNKFHAIKMNNEKYSNFALSASMTEP